MIGMSISLWTIHLNQYSDLCVLQEESEKKTYQIACESQIEYDCTNL